MVGSGLKKWALSMNMRVEKGIAFGVVQGYLVSMWEGAGTKSIFINGYMGQESYRQALESFLSPMAGQYRIKTYRIEPSGLYLEFGDTVGTMKKIESIFTLVLSKMTELQIPDAGFCSVCGEAIVGSAVAIRLGNKVLKMNQNCYDAIRAELTQQAQDQEAKPLNIGRGTLGAILGALVGSIPWMVAFYFGWFVGWFGFVIALCARKGYEILGGRTSKAKVVIVIVCSFIGLFIAQNMGYIIELYRAIAQEYGTTPTLGEVINTLIFAITTEPEISGPYWGDLALGVLFLVLGFYSIIANMVRESRNPLSTISEIRL